MDLTVVVVLAGTCLLYILMAWLFLRVYREWGPVRRGILVFLVLFPLEGLMGGPTAGLLPLLIGTLAVLAQLAFVAWNALRHQRRQSLSHLAAAGVYVAMVAFVWGYNYFNTQVAARRAAVIIAACRAYEAKHGQLPESLDDLVPAFLSSVPRARYTLAASQFFYRKATQPSDASHLLYYYPIALQRRVYNFGTDSWSVWGF